jgi:hypothetical protein
MSLLFSIPSTLPSHLVTEMTIVLRMVMETVGTETVGTKAVGTEILATEILGGLGSLFSAFFYIGIQQNLSDRTPSCDNRRPDWTKYDSPRSTRDGLKPALA